MILLYSNCQASYPELIDVQHVCNHHPHIDLAVARNSLDLTFDLTFDLIFDLISFFMGHGPTTAGAIYVATAVQAASSLCQDGGVQSSVARRDFRRADRHRTCSGDRGDAEEEK